MDRFYDGILAVKLNHRENDLNMVLLSCYPPTEISVWVRHGQSFLAHLLSLIYTYSDCDIGADFSARIGTHSDILEGCDSVPEREALDKIVNQHVHSFKELLNDAKFCVLNGRFMSHYFTSISSKGNSVVDYMCTPLDTCKRC